MREMVKRFPISARKSWWVVVRDLVRRPRRRADGKPFWTRRQWLDHLWKAHWRKWLRGPWRCKMGTHRVGTESDTGMGG